MSLPTSVSRDPHELSQREFAGMLGHLFSRNGGEGMYGALAPYGVDIREDADHFFVEAELPGFKKEEVDISMENQMLTISAEHKSEKKNDGNKGEMLLHERRYSRFQRSFTLPPTVDGQGVQAKLADGLLTITLNKREETKPRKISVS